MRYSIVLKQPLLLKTMLIAIAIIFLFSNKAIAQSNTGSGYEALGNNGTGTFNSGFGFYALWANYSGSRNTAIGSHSLANSYGSPNNNTGVGYRALAGGSPVGGMGSYNILPLDQRHCKVLLQVAIIIVLLAQTHFIPIPQDLIIQLLVMVPFTPTLQEILI